MLASLFRDLRFAARTLCRSPLFAAAAVAVIALGSGAVTTVGSAANALLLRPLPGVADAARLVRLERVRRDGEGGTASSSYPFYADVRDRARTLAGVAAWSKATLTLSAGGAGSAGSTAYGNLVSDNYFALLGVRPVLGRFFAPAAGRADAADAAEPAVVVSERFWRTRLGADPGVVGRTLRVNGHPATLVGVAPAAFEGLDRPIRTDAWVPLSMQRQLRPRSDPADASASWLRLCGRLRGGASRDAAGRELAALAAARVASGAEPADLRAFDRFRVTALTGLPSDARVALGGFLGLLLAAAALVLLIASVNVAALLSARAAARRRELALRAALGAGRARLVRPLLAEVAVLFALGALGGVGLAAAATAALARLPLPALAGAVSLSLELSPDGRVLAFALATSLFVGLAVALAPALQEARRGLAARLRADSAGAGRRTRGTRALVVGQLALSLLLLVTAGLFLRALERGRHVDPGFDAAGVSVAALDAEAWGYDEPKARAFYQALRERVAALPGVTAASYTEFLPLVMHATGDEIQVDGAAGAGAAGTRPAEGAGAGSVAVSLSLVDVDYFAALRLPLVRGRAFGAADGPGAPKVAVVNATLARRHWPGGDAVGRTFGFHGERVTVVGVARDAKYATLAEPATPMVYFPLAQQWRPARALVVRAAAAGPAQLAPAIAREVAALDPAVPRPTVTSLRAENGVVLLPQRAAALVAGALGAAGLLLASVGLYGVIAYAVGQRRREIGIRVAVGARRRDVLALVVGDGMRLAALGVLLGVALGAAATRLLRGLLFDVSPLDAATFAATSALLAAVALVASYLPARRAAAADPQAVLRAE